MNSALSCCVSPLPGWAAQGGGSCWPQHCIREGPGESQHRFTRKVEGSSSWDGSHNAMAVAEHPAHSWQRPSQCPGVDAADTTPQHPWVLSGAAARACCHAAPGAPHQPGRQASWDVLGGHHLGAAVTSGRGWGGRTQPPQTPSTPHSAWEGEPQKRSEGSPIGKDAQTRGALTLILIPTLIQCCL